VVILDVKVHMGNRLHGTVVDVFLCMGCHGARGYEDT